MKDFDPDALGPVPVGECNRKFDAMQAQDDEEDDMEANQAPQEYPSNPNLWREGANHLEEAKNYYGDDNGLDDQAVGPLANRWYSNSIASAT